MRLPNATGRWDWYWLSQNIPVTVILANHKLPWNKKGLSRNKDITVDLMCDLDVELINATDKWDWLHLTSIISISDILTHPGLPWRKDGLSLNKEMTVALMQRLNEVLGESRCYWNWEELSRTIPISDILSHHDLPWQRYGLSQNKEITVALMRELDAKLTNATGGWCWYSLSVVISISDIIAHSKLPWRKTGLSQNNEMTVTLMRELDDAVGAWYWRGLTKVIPAEEIREKPDWPWEEDLLDLNPGATLDDVIYSSKRTNDNASIDETKANPLHTWSKGTMSRNPRITMEMVLANPDD